MIHFLRVIKHLQNRCAQSVRQRLLSWTKPARSSLLLSTLADLARSKSELVAENALLRQQLLILHRQVKRPVYTKTDRMLLVLLARMVRSWKQALVIVQPETLLRWHRQAFRWFWRRRSNRAATKQPKIADETVALIKTMALNNRLWGAERIRGELREVRAFASPSVPSKSICSKGVCVPSLRRGQPSYTTMRLRSGRAISCR